MTEHETPIQKILRENQLRIEKSQTNESLEIVARRLFNLQKCKNEIGMKTRNNIYSYRAKLAQPKTNQFKRNISSIQNLSQMIKHSAASINNVVGC